MNPPPEAGTLREVPCFYCAVIQASVPPDGFGGLGTCRDPTSGAATASRNALCNMCRWVHRDNCPRIRDEHAAVVCGRLNAALNELRKHPEDQEKEHFMHMQTQAQEALQLSPEFIERILQTARVIAATEQQDN